MFTYFNINLLVDITLFTFGYLQTHFINLNYTPPQKKYK